MLRFVRKWLTGKPDISVEHKDYVYVSMMGSNPITFDELTKLNLTPITYLGVRYVLATTNILTPVIVCFAAGYNRPDCELKYVIRDNGELDNREFEYLWKCAEHDCTKID